MKLTQVWRGLAVLPDLVKQFSEITCAARAIEGDFRIVAIFETVGAVNGLFQEAAQFLPFLLVSRLRLVR